MWTCYMIPNNSFYNWNYWCLIEGDLLYNTVLLSAKHQHESAIGMPMSPALEPPCHLPSHPNPRSCYRKTWKASQICVSSLGRGHANLLSIIPIFKYMCYQGKHMNKNGQNVMKTCVISHKKWIASPGSIQDPEAGALGWPGGMVRGGKWVEVQDGEYVYISGRFMVMCGRTNTILWSKKKN